MATVVGPTPASREVARTEQARAFPGGRGPRRPTFSTRPTRGARRGSTGCRRD